MQRVPLGQSSDGQGRKIAIQKAPAPPQQGNENAERYEKEERVAMRLNKNLVNLLKELEDRVDEADKKAIKQTLHDVEDDLVSLDSLQSVRTLGKRPREQSAQRKEPGDGHHGEALVTASVGSNEDLDFLDEDLMRSHESRETGYMGQNSEVQWLRSVQRQAERGNSDPQGQRYGPPGASSAAIDERSEALHERRQNARPGSMQHITDATFYLDGDDIEVDIAVDPNEMPGPDIAEKLFDCYLETVQGTFPLMPANFEDQFRRYIQSLRYRNPYQIPPQWRATMNLLFAIGAKYSHLIGAEWRGDERDHLVYMTRAVQLLGLKDTISFLAAPSLGRVQATGTLAFYFLVIGHVSRAWIMSGLSVRLALALGLHLRNEDDSMNDSRREPLVKTWWCLHSVECLVSSITGRPPVIGNEDCTVTLPQYEPGSPTRDTNAARRHSRVRTNYSSPQTVGSSAASDSGQRDADGSHYLHTYVTLTIISQKVLLSLYSPRTAVQSWETKITELLKELEDWVKTALPSDDIRPSNSTQRPELNRERFLLRIYYWSTKVLITRPCLCRIERRIATESSKSMNFNAESAETCVESARNMTMLFPEQPDTQFIYSQGPWWDVVHLIMQSVAVLLLEMAYEGKHLKDERDDILTCIKKMIRWLRAMKVSDPVAARAHDVVYKILNTCAPALREQVKELIADDTGWTSRPAKPTRSAPQSASWEEMPPNFPPPLSQDHFMDPLLPYPLPEQQPTSFAFGNPFMTNFDQGVPLVDMQQLWWQSAPLSHLNFNPSAMNMSQQQLMQQQMQQQMHQQMQQSGLAEQEDIQGSS
ncbi:uncharacterized protein J4E79_001836 [Alternaria viburni]|uniref:uncharacterized protein n=1 Tax=Alternaria viburni TaxID=566460 RepID=UPI0020C52BB7|nr:uncharacterized protein J4E79_001836 [Alternaria viburni]KAI4667152.1 hypothetical protein J4E79_001836 [Alternaria viburni]